MKNDKELAGLLGVFKEVKSEADEYSKILNKTILDATMSGAAIVWSRFHGYIGYKIASLIENYNDAVENLGQFVDTNNIGVKQVIIEEGEGDEKGLQDVAESLVNLKIGSSSAVSYIESLSSKVSMKDKDKLASLLNEVSTLESYSQPLHAHLVEAIESYEEGKHIAAAITAAKVAIHCLEQIDGKTDEEKVTTLINADLIRKDLGEKYLTGIRRARNIFSHEVNYIPKPQEALSMITESVDLSLFLPKIKRNSN